MSLSNLNKHIELCTRRLELADQAFMSTAAGDYAHADQCDEEIDAINLQLVELNEEARNDNQEPVEVNQKPKVYCPDCGAELQPIIHEQRIEPFRTYLYFYCDGRCHKEYCKKQGIEPDKVLNGTPKFYVEFGYGESLIDIDELIAREAAAVEIERMHGKLPYNFAPHNIVLRVFNRVLCRYKSKHVGLDAVYLMGWVYGIRAERKRRSSPNRKKNDIAS